MKLSFVLSLSFALALTGGCQAFVEFDPDLLDGGDAAKSLGTPADDDVLDGGVAD